MLEVAVNLAPQHPHHSPGKRRPEQHLDWVERDQRVPDARQAAGRAQRDRCTDVEEPPQTEASADPEPLRGYQSF